MNKLDRHNPTPLYEQIKLILREQILNSELSPGTQLPTEIELCQQFDVSRITVGKALNELARSGLIERIQGKGSIVSRRPIQETFATISGFTETMQRHGLRARSKILSIEVVDGDLNLYKAFDLPANSHQHFMRFRRLCFVENRPAVILTTLMREELGQKFKEHELENASFYKLYEEILGRKVVRNEATLMPVIATPEAVELLQVKPGSAHFLFRGLSYVEGDLPVELATGIFHGDLFQFSGTIYRVREEANIRA